MAKRTHRNASGGEPEAAKPNGRTSLMLPATSWGATLVALGVLGVFGYFNDRQTRELRQVVDYRLDQLDTRLLQLSKKIDAVGTRAAAAPQRGPDPNRVYSVRTDGAPVKGPLTAAVTIAEFSDFQ